MCIAVTRGWGGQRARERERAKCSHQQNAHDHFKDSRKLHVLCNIYSLLEEHSRARAVPLIKVTLRLRNVLHTVHAKCIPQYRDDIT